MNQEQTSSSKQPTKLKSGTISSIVSSAILVLAHVAILLFVFWSYKYYSIYPSIFGSLVAIVLLVLLIVDVIHIVGINYSDIALKIVSGTLAFFILLGGTFGSYYINKVNNIVGGVLGNNSKYETYSGVFVSYRKDEGKPKLDTIEGLAGKKVGMLVETTNGITYIAEDILSKAKIDYGRVDYKTNSELLTALIDGDVDAIVITSGYRSIIENDDESSFKRYLEKFVDFNQYERELEVKTNKTQKNINTEPFNMLLIGWSRVDIGSSIGLADAIIVATINPQTYTVSMMSIARDSFVPIACYGGEYDKINSGRSTSRACFIETVENFIGMDIDYYMEMDYLGLVAVVNAIGGIMINNPVSFTLDGVYVEEGNYLADGAQVLEFCRERHHMPNGDFDRQQHQKEVIIEIAKKFVEAGDVSLALYAMEEASPFMSTDLTLNQLTSIFNLLLNTKNYTSLETFDLVDFHTLRITGYGGILYYSYSMRLPLWVYLIYKGSYDESIGHIKEVMGKYNKVNQSKNFEYSIFEPYERAPFYSMEYEHKFLFEPDPMPNYWADLIGMSQSDAMAWAKEKGVSLSVNIVKSSSSNYVKEYEGKVYDQSVRYGSLVSDYPSGVITVMGTSEIDPNKQVPDFVEHNYSKAVTWGKEHGIRISIDFDTNVEGKVGDVVWQTPEAGTPISGVERVKITVKAGSSTISFDNNGMDTSVPGSITVITGDDAVKFGSPGSTTVEKDGKTYVFTGWFTSPSGGTKVSNSDEVGGNVTVYAQWKLKESESSEGEETTEGETTEETPGGNTEQGETPSGDGDQGETPSGDGDQGETPSGDGDQGETPSGEGEDNA